MFFQSDCQWCHTNKRQKREMIWSLPLKQWLHRESVQLQSWALWAAVSCERDSLQGQAGLNDADLRSAAAAAAVLLCVSVWCGEKTPGQQYRHVYINIYSHTTYIEWSDEGAQEMDEFFPVAALCAEEFHQLPDTHTHKQKQMRITKGSFWNFSWWSGPTIFSFYLGWNSIILLKSQTKTFVKKNTHT